jgi:hypothetical protein
MVGMPTGYRTSLPWTLHLYRGLQTARAVLVPVALTLPVVGFFMAITRRGLWDVDWIVHRATLFSALTGLFVVAWLSLEASVESLLSGPLASVPLVGGLAPALLAAAVVAVSQRSVGGLLSRRRRSSGAPLAELVRRVAGEIAAERDEERLPGRVVDCLAAHLHPSHAALLLRASEDTRWCAWCTDPGVPAAVVASAALDPLASAEHVVVVTDGGPCLVTRILRDGALAGLLLLGARPAGRFYARDERPMIALLLATIAPRLPTPS